MRPGTAQGYPYTPGNERLEVVIEAVAEHLLKAENGKQKAENRKQKAETFLKAES